jgi:hypothetical protein
MIKTEKLKLYAGRIGLFVAGGLLVFAVMSFTVVNNAKKANVELTQTLDTSRYEAGRLLADAKAQFEANNFIEARNSLTSLFNKQPGSEEAVEGKTLMVSVENAQKRADAMWEAALPGIKQQWADEFAGELRAKSDEARALLEQNMEAAINKEWEKVEPKLWEEWKEQTL